ncbi:hypothetical protein [Haloarcula regularis]|uniref:hypothetical protein n=1 Tax=Haloarcula regularis TaxID=3033392 RepID=UPI0023E87FB8|nr:hypothetical protein [Halomicroarcula sp. SYNS111]
MLWLEARVGPGPADVLDAKRRVGDDRETQGCPEEWPPPSEPSIVRIVPDCWLVGSPLNGQ